MTPVDLDAEMARLQAEARAQLRARDEREREEAALLGEAEPDERQPLEPVAATPGKDALDALANLNKAAKVGAAVNDGLETAKQAADSASKWTLLQKLGFALGGVVVFVVSWKLFLRPIVEAVIAVAVLLLILVVIAKLLGWTDKLKSKDEDA